MPTTTLSLRSSDRALTPADVGRIIGRSRRTVFDHMRAGRLESRRIGRGYVTTIDAVLEFARAYPQYIQEWRTCPREDPDSILAE